MRTGLSDVEPGLGIKTALHVLTLILLFPLSTCNVSSTGLARKGFSIQSSRHPTCLSQAGLHPHLLALFRRCASWDDPMSPPHPAINQSPLIPSRDTQEVFPALTQHIPYVEVAPTSSSLCILFNKGDSALPAAPGAWICVGICVRLQKAGNTWTMVTSSRLFRPIYSPR